MKKQLTIVLFALASSVFGQGFSVDSLEVEFTSKSGDGRTFVSTELLIIENAGDTNLTYSYFQKGQLNKKFKCSLKDGNFEIVSDGLEHNEKLDLIETLEMSVLGDSIKVYSFEAMWMPRNAPYYKICKEYGLLVNGRKRQRLTAWNKTSVHLSFPEEYPGDGDFNK